MNAVIIRTHSNAAAGTFRRDGECVCNSRKSRAWRGLNPSTYQPPPHMVCVCVCVCVCVSFQRPETWCPPMTQIGAPHASSHCCGWRGSCEHTNAAVASCEGEKKIKGGNEVSEWGRGGRGTGRWRGRGTRVRAADFLFFSGIWNRFFVGLLDLDVTSDLWSYNWTWEDSPRQQSLTGSWKLVFKLELGIFFFFPWESWDRWCYVVCAVSSFMQKLTWQLTKSSFKVNEIQTN